MTPGIWQNASSGGGYSVVYTFPGKNCKVSTYPFRFSRMVDTFFGAVAGLIISIQQGQ